MLNSNVLSTDTTVDEIVESDVELDYPDVVDPDHDSPQEMGNPDIEVTDEARKNSQTSKVWAMDALLKGNLEDAKNFLTISITQNPKSPMLFASRASVFVKLKKPNAAIQDADAALKMKADSAKGYKARGMARAQLGLWKGAAKDLHMAFELEFDEETYVILKKVESNVKKIEGHHLKYARLRRAKKLRELELEAKRCQDVAAASVLRDGKIIGIHTLGDLNAKLDAASKLFRLTVIFFTATWHDPCTYISPAYKILAETYPKVVFLKVDTDEANDAAVAWNVACLPCFVLVKNGKEVDKLIGIEKYSLDRMIKYHAGHGIQFS